MTWMATLKARLTDSDGSAALKADSDGINDGSLGINDGKLDSDGMHVGSLDSDGINMAHLTRMACT